MKKTEDLIYDLLDGFSKDIIQRANEKKQNVSNKIPKSFKVEVNRTPAILKGRLVAWEWVIPAWETGRGPTKKGGDGALFRGIRRWLVAKNIKPKGKYKDENKALDSAAYVISQKIHKEGTALWNSRDSRFSGNRSMTISDFINDKNINTFIKQFSELIVKAEITPLLDFRTTI